MTSMARMPTGSSMKIEYGTFHTSQFSARVAILSNPQRVFILNASFQVSLK